MQKGANYEFLVVLDTNVLISSLWGGSAIGRIMDGITSGRLLPAVSSQMLAELYEVGQRPKIRKKFPWPVFTEIYSTYAETCLHVKPRRKIYASRDRKDNIFLMCAVEAEADFIITGDDHLLCLHPFQGIQILQPKAFADLL